jgi:hypothetical protein
MESKLLDIGYRKKIINEIKGDENTQRKVASYKKFNMQEDNFYQYVKEYLESKLDKETVNEMTVFASINLQRRISKAEASIYKKSPRREILVDGKESGEMEEVYAAMDVDTVMRRANEAYKYDGQCALQVFPHGGEIKCRVLLRHQFDVIPDETNPEEAMAYIISNFDNTSRDRVKRDNDKTGYSQGDKYRDSVNQEIADYDDQAARKERYYVWTKSLNFVMNGMGEILDKVTEEVITEFTEEDPNIMSPIAEFNCIPFIDVSQYKNFEYWVRGYDSLYDATINYNTILTSEFQTVELQGHAQAFYKGDANHMPENVRIGPDKIIHIPIDPNNPTNSEFGFANPGSDLGGIRMFRESFLAAFLTSRGLDTSIISGQPQAQQSSSGVEKLLQMIEKFEASQEDFSVFKNAETKLLKIVSSFIKALSTEVIDGEPVLNETFNIDTGTSFPELSLRFSGPEMIKSESEMLDIAQKELEMGLTSRVHILMNLKDMTREQAENHIKEVDAYEGINGSDKPAQV